VEMEISTAKVLAA